MARYDPRYPVGKTRLETIGVIISAAIMSAASIEVMQSSVMELLSSEHEISLDIYTYVILGSTIVLKIFLFFYCYQLREVSGSALAVAEDHFNDIISNSGAIMTAALASERADLWWMDPVGGGLIAVYIVFRWIILAKNHIDKLVGICADPEFIEHVKQVADTHHSLLQTDAIRVYYFGQRHIVELEVILPATMTVRESHDIALELQHRIEALDEVERCFVHVDYQSRQDELPEHKTERELILGAGEMLPGRSSWC
ncbi:hypothetical protein GUITHDRAFT_77758 [Guillardia theta CCMP2712]|uniref:Uncharacterized protein n=1 Tax=Guillardia theta (strain CCMP2712) TaxID=905079 RepID=L1IN96_GUITC|nr:hypothetical protein GUITHDRAFT_77758 [Guillardia theta CCMP2712]EKX37751.1 hypothetical protein GUITHDRAFT_77758 [Guillardia theta CCMP2712]|eukprot:XP_005824731.1 hypothetical protein GUITHDRAFT_77758 [Guillardia theta CCMP2712]